MKKENFETCKRIALELEEYYNGNIYRCPECGEMFSSTEETPTTCPSCHHIEEEEYGFDQCSLYDYFDDVLDIEYRIGYNKEYRSVKILIAFGGPNIYIDTATKHVELYWWGDDASFRIDTDVCGEIDNIFEEYYNS